MIIIPFIVNVVTTYYPVIARNEVTKQSRLFVSIDNSFIRIASSQAARNDGDAGSEQLRNVFDYAVAFACSSAASLSAICF